MPHGFVWNLLKGFIILLITLNPGTTNAQQPPASSLNHHKPVIKNNSVLNHPRQPESDCSNGIDDDRNGLTDAKDFHCYFNGENSMDECRPTKIIWASSNWGLHWIDLETKEERLVVPRDEHTYDDISWASNGKLYGADRAGGIFEIDPYTYTHTPVGDAEGYYYSNGMTGDAAENLYMTSYTTSSECHLVKFNVATKKTQFILNLTANQLNSAGDLCFINGYLYVSCVGNIIAKINLTTRTVEKLQLLNSPILDGPYGMTTLGDGFLYISNNMSEIHQVDMTTMKASYYGEFSQPNFFALGFTSYTDLCNGPGCRAKLNITTEQFPPYCANEGVQITANGSGIKGQSGYVWTLPDGSQTTGKTLLAKQRGTYYVTYHTLPDTCSVTDSIILNIAGDPIINLGKDTFVCVNSSLLLSPQKNKDITAFYWDDGSTGATRLVTTPGKYWVEAINHCGVSSDTILVTAKDWVPVYIGNDTLICPSTLIEIKNMQPVDPTAMYKWSNGLTGNKIIADLPGVYWLESSNACGTVRDEIIITGKDSCICKPFYPEANTGDDRWLCTYDTLMLSNAMHQDGFSYLWNDGSTGRDMVIRKTGTYTVDVSTYCGTISDTIIVHPKIDECECYLYVPNAFTPNRDGKNDLFEVRSNCVVKGTIRIFNRWGGIVFSSDDIKKGWNGNVGNVQQPSGLYIYHVYYEYVNRPDKFMKKGSLTLVR